MEAERGAEIVEHYDGNVCSQSWYRLRIHLGRLHEGSAVCNTALMGDFSKNTKSESIVGEQRNIDPALQIQYSFDRVLTGSSILL